MYSINQSILKAVISLSIGHAGFDTVIFEHIGQPRRRLTVRQIAKLFHANHANIGVPTELIVTNSY